MTLHRRAVDIPPFAFPVLLADVGGTNARFALLPAPDDEIEHAVVVPTRAFPGPAEAIRESVLAPSGATPRSLLLAVAGPVGERGVRLTNADWTIEPARLVADLGLEEVAVLNDFEALSLALPSIGAEDLVRLGTGEGRFDGTRLVVGPGTGLGVAGLVPAAGRFVPVAGEGGHVALGPETEEEFALWPHLPRFHGRISAEGLLSGDGLGRIHTGLSRMETGRDGFETGEAVTAAAAAGDPLAARAVALFSRLLGRVCGDLALVFLARGGVYLGGGIVPRLAERFDGAAFRAAFEAKAPMEAVLRAIPAFVIVKEKPAFDGLAAFAREPNRFAVSLVGRRIRA